MRRFFFLGRVMAAGQATGVVDIKTHSKVRTTELLSSYEPVIFHLPPGKVPFSFDFFQDRVQGPTKVASVLMTWKPPSC